MQEAREAPPQAATGRAEPQRGSGRRRGGRFVGTDQTNLICQNYSEKNEEKEEEEEEEEKEEKEEKEKEEKEDDYRGKDKQDGDQGERLCC